MKKITKTTIASIAAIIFSMGCLGTAFAETYDGVTLKSNGFIAVDSNGNGSLDDGDYSIYAEDIARVAEHTVGGKKAIATEMFNKAGVTITPDANGIYKFTDLVNGVDTVYEKGESTGQNDVYKAIRDKAASEGKDSSLGYGNISDNSTPADAATALFNAIEQDNVNYKTQGQEEVTSNPSSFGLCGGDIEVIKVGDGTVTIPNAATAYKFYIFGYGMSFNGEYTSGWTYAYLMRPGDVVTSISCNYCAMGIAPYGDRIYCIDVNDSNMTRADAYLSWDGNTATMRGPTSYSQYTVCCLLGVK